MIGVSILDQVRSSCRSVAGRARQVRIDVDKLSAYAEELASAGAGSTEFDAEHHFRGDLESTVGYLLCLDSINFGSGWFPLLIKRPGMSGYFTVSTALKDKFESGGWTPGQLTEMTGPDLAEVLGQSGNAAVRELMDWFATALNELGRWVLDRFGGRYSAAVEEAGGSAARLVELLIEMPLFRDVSDYRGQQLWLLKRAQLTAVDLSLAFDGAGPGEFADLDTLTIFADNLVPHVLRTDGLLRYDADLAATIASGRLLGPGSEPEQEIRACAVQAVELLVAALGGSVTAADLDYLLWNRGQAVDYRLLPRHRTRTTNY